MEGLDVRTLALILGRGAQCDGFSRWLRLHPRCLASCPLAVSDPPLFNFAHWTLGRVWGFARSAAHCTLGRVSGFPRS